MKLKEVKTGRLKDLKIYGLTQEDQSIEFILTKAEKVAVVELINQMHNRFLKVVKRDNIELMK
jgi:hypothetical protein